MCDFLLVYQIYTIYSTIYHFYSIHGNPLKDAGMQRISKELAQHPRIVSLDVSDCELTDKSMEFICPLLPNSGSKTGDYK